MEAKRILKDIDVQFLSLVTAGANGKSLIYKSANQGTLNFQKEIKILKTDEEKHLVYATVYEPDTVDSQGDTATAAEIEKACHKFSENLRLLKVDTQHNFEENGSVVVENFIMRSADPMFPTTKTGSWVTVIKVIADEIWTLVKSGEIGGLSLAGMSAVEAVKKTIEPPAPKETNVIKNIFSAIKKGWAEITKDFNAELLEDEIQQKVWALMDAIQKIMNDDAVTDKIPAVNASIDQFKTSVAVNTNKSKTNEDDMKPEEVTKIVTDAVTAAVKPVTEELATLKADLTKASGRIEEVAKKSPGSTQLEEEPTPVKKSKTNWLS